VTHLFLQCMFAFLSDEDVQARPTSSDFAAKRKQSKRRPRRKEDKIWSFQFGELERSGRAIFCRFFARLQAKYKVASRVDGKLINVTRGRGVCTAGSDF
jgi:hypothetical protein